MPSLELNEEEVKQTIAEQLDTWSSSNPPHVRQWWAESVSGQKVSDIGQTDPTLQDVPTEANDRLVAVQEPLNFSRGRVKPRFPRPQP